MSKWRMSSHIDFVEGQQCTFPPYNIEGTGLLGYKSNVVKIQNQNLANRAETWKIAQFELLTCFKDSEASTQSLKVATRYPIVAKE